MSELTRKSLEEKLDGLETLIEKIKENDSALADVLEELLPIARDYLDQYDLDDCAKLIAIIKELIQELLNILHRGIQSPTNDPRISEASEKKESNSGGRSR